MLFGEGGESEQFLGDLRELARCGQGYLLNHEGVSPLVYGMLPDLSYDYPLKVNRQENARGLRLYEQFVKPTTSSPAGLKRPPRP